MRKMGSAPGPNGKFVKGGKSYGGPGRKVGACMVGDKPLTPKEKAVRWRANNPEKLYEAKIRWQEAHPEQHQESCRRRRLKGYGLTPETYDTMWKAQNYKCSICKSQKSSSIKGWHIDHCHQTKQVRGILCAKCNAMLGGAKDNIETLLSAISYLQKSSGKLC